MLYLQFLFCSVRQNRILGSCHTKIATDSPAPTPANGPQWQALHSEVETVQSEKCKKSILKTFVNQGPCNEAWWCIGNSWRLIFKGMHSLASSRISNTYGHVQVHMGHNGQGDMPNTGKPYGGCTKGHTFPAISRSTEFFSETFLK